LQVDRFDDCQSLRVLILTSPKAGSGAGRDEIPKVERRLGELGISCAVIVSIDEMRELLNKTDSYKRTIVVAAGGDGTYCLAATLIRESQIRESRIRESRIRESRIRESRGGDLLNGSIADTDRDPAGHRTYLLPMPLGTENLLAREYKHSNLADDVIAALRFGAVQETDLGLCGDRVFLIMASSGFDAEVVRWLHLTRGGHISRLTYLKPIIRSMFSFRFPPQRVTVDGEFIGEFAWVMAFNLPQYGGDLRIEPDADGTDGCLDVILFKNRGILSGLRYVWKIARAKHLTDASVHRVRGKEISVESSQRVPLQIDGDCIGELPATIRVLPKAMSLVMPASGEADHGH
jgi:diacylglycerol kinase family enzyme